MGIAGVRAIAVMVERLRGQVRYGNEVLRVARGHRVVQRVGGGHGADQDQHDEAHALLTVKRDTMPNATVPVETNTPMKFQAPDQITAACGFSEWL